MTASPSTATSCAPRRVRSGTTWWSRPSSRAGRAGMPVRHSRVGRGHPGAERRRLRREVADTITRVRLLDRAAARCAGCRQRAGLRLPHQRAQAAPMRPSSWRWSSRWTPRVAARRCATASWRPRWALAAASAPTRARCGRRCWRCGPRKGMVLDAADHDTWSVGSFFTNPVVHPDSLRAAGRHDRRAGAALSGAGRRQAGRRLAGRAGRLRQGLSEPDRRTRALPAVHQARAGADQSRWCRLPTTCWRWPEPSATGCAMCLVSHLVPEPVLVGCVL